MLKIKDESPQKNVLLACLPQPLVVELIFLDVQRTLANKFEKHNHIITKARNKS